MTKDLRPQQLGVGDPTAFSLPCPNCGAELTLIAFEKNSCDHCRKAPAPRMLPLFLKMQIAGVLIAAAIVFVLRESFLMKDMAKPGDKGPVIIVLILAGGVLLFIDDIVKAVGGGKDAEVSKRIAKVGNHYFRLGQHQKSLAFYSYWLTRHSADAVIPSQVRDCIIICNEDMTENNNLISTANDLLFSELVNIYLRYPKHRNGSFTNALIDVANDSAKQLAICDNAVSVNTTPNGLPSEAFISLGQQLVYKAPASARIFDPKSEIPLAVSKPTEGYYFIHTTRSAPLNITRQSLQDERRLFTYFHRNLITTITNRRIFIEDFTNDYAAKTWPLSSFRVKDVSQNTVTLVSSDKVVIKIEMTGFVQPYDYFHDNRIYVKRLIKIFET